MNTISAAINIAVDIKTKHTVFTIGSISVISIRDVYTLINNYLTVVWVFVLLAYGQEGAFIAKFSWFI